MRAVRHDMNQPNRGSARPLVAALTLVSMALVGGDLRAVESSRPSAPSPGRSKAPIALDEVTEGEVQETLTYRWRLQGVAGAVAGLFLPRRGEGILRQAALPNGHLRSDLLITSPDSDKGEFWTYGAEFDAETSNTVRAWSSYFFRGKRQAKNQEVSEQGVTDITAGIHRLRVGRPRTKQRQRIWSDGRIYAVEVTPLGWENIELANGARPLAEHYTIEGVAGAGERLWKGRIEVWLARDAAGSPLQILIERGWASVLLVQNPQSEAREAP